MLGRYNAVRFVREGPAEMRFYRRGAVFYFRLWRNEPTWTERFVEVRATEDEALLLGSLLEDAAVSGSPGTLDIDRRTGFSIMPAPEGLLCLEMHDDTELAPLHLHLAGGLADKIAQELYAMVARLPSTVEPT